MPGQSQLIKEKKRLDKKKNPHHVNSVPALHRVHRRPIRPGAELDDGNEAADANRDTSESY